LFKSHDIIAGECLGLDKFIDNQDLGTSRDLFKSHDIIAGVGFEPHDLEVMSLAS